MDNQALLTTKLMPPALRREAVVRERLHARIRDGEQRALTLVAAGPGSGKSTLLAAWRNEVSSNRPVAWLTLGESENDPVVLCAYVLQAIRAIRPGFGPDIDAALAMPAPRLEDALRALVNEAAAQDALALVLDDFHRVKSREAVDVVAWLAENHAPGFQLIIATRTDPLLPLASLRAHGELVELRTNELALTVAEAKEFLNGRLELDLSTEQVAALVEKTEGWPAGIYLVALSLKRAPEPEEFVRLLSGSSRHVVDFLVDEVLRREPPELQEFLTRCSILERMTGPLCDAVLGREGSHDTLASLWGSNLFLTAIGDRGEWYRFHRLFADVLSTELERREPHLLAELHRRAAAWLYQAGDVESAVGHAFVGGAFEDAADMISESWITYRDSGKAASIRAWLARLPADTVSRRPTLVRAGARVRVVEVSNERDAFLEAVRKRYPDGPDPLFGELLARSWIGDAGGAVASARRWMAAEPPTSEFWPTVCETLGYCLYNNDELEESMGWLNEARSLALASEQWVIGAAATAELSLVVGERGESSEQKRLADDAYACLAEHGRPSAPGYQAVVLTARGSALAARGLLEEALEPLERGFELRPPTRFQILGAILPLIPVVRRVGDRDDATSLLSEAQSVLNGCRDPGGFRRRLAEVERAFDRRLTASQEHPNDLSTAELRVLRLLAAGLSERQVGGELYVSFNTVHGHVKSIYRKLSVSSKQQALDAARSRGLV
jgi:LuxR family maltose regulon positive regulatory protein